MKKQEKEKIINYWRKTAAHDFKTMKGLFEIRRYPDSLFYGHIVIEKILKALVVYQTNEKAPYIHNLTKLSELAELNLEEKDYDLLDVLNNFNIRSRYPDYKLSFYKQYRDKEKASRYLEEVTELYKKLCQILNQKTKPKN